MISVAPPVKGGYITHVFAINYTEQFLNNKMSIYVDTEEF